MAYTSASTALNQKLSVKANERDPMNALPKIATWLFASNSFCLETMFESRMVSDQNIKRMVKALAKTDIRLMVRAILVAPMAKMEKNAPNIW